MESRRKEHKSGATVADLPPYRDPSSGLLSKFPRWMLPYLQLARIDKPGHITVTIHLIGAIQAGILLEVPPQNLGTICLYMAIASVIFLWTNFVWNDICDQEVDGRVARSRHRPLVRGAVSRQSAVAFNIFLGALLLAFLAPLPIACKMYTVPIAAGAIFYPLSKRITNYTQIVMATVISTGSFMGAAAVGITPLPHPSSFRLQSIVTVSEWTPADPIAIPSFVATYSLLGVWGMIYELIYSYQDASWDKNAGIGTMTLLFSKEASAKAFLVALAVLQASIYQYVGMLIDAHLTYWSISTILVASSLFLEIYSVDLSKEESCRYWFAVGAALTSSAMLCGFCGEYYIREFENRH